MDIPPSIASLLPHETFRTEGIGMSGANVLVFPDRVLKTQPLSPDALRERQMLQWLPGRIPSPRLLAWEERADTSYLLMTRLPGDMACSELWLARPQELVEVLAQALGSLWQVDITHCPSDCRLAHKLRQARCNVEQGLVDVENTEPETFGPGGFADPEELLRWLEANAPREEPVLSHGDFCLPNVFLRDGQLSGFLDLGRCGIADKWCDIAILARSLRHNFSGYYTGKPSPGYREEMFFEALGIAPDPEKLRYYQLLDELF